MHRSALASALGVSSALLVLGGCGSGSGSGGRAHAAAHPPRNCQQAVAGTLSRVVRRVYREGVQSERTVIAQRAIAGSRALSEAVASGNAAAAAATAKALVASGHMTNLLVKDAHGRVLADAGGEALAPLTGTIAGPNGGAVGSYVTSVWSDIGFLEESGALSQGSIALRVKGRSIGGSRRLADGHLPAEGSLTLAGAPYQYASFGGKRFPSSEPVRMYVLRSLSSIAPLCGADERQTVARTLSRVAKLIYDGEAGHRTRGQVSRVEGDPALLAAVARRDPAATKRAVEALLNQHIVRLRVFAAGRVLTDVGGPFVLAPVRGTLRLAERTIGSFILSIQDDEGYLRLAGRLAGLPVLMYMDISGREVLVKNSLGPEPGTVPDSGHYTYKGAEYDVYTLHARAFPEGPLTIRVLIPYPYS